MASWSWYAALADKPMLVRTILECRAAGTDLCIVAVGPHDTPCAEVFDEVNEQLLQIIWACEPLLIVEKFDVGNLEYLPANWDRPCFAIDTAASVPIIHLNFAHEFQHEGHTLLFPSNIEMTASGWDSQQRRSVPRPQRSRHLFKVACSALKGAMRRALRGNYMTREAIRLINDQGVLFNDCGVYYDGHERRVGRFHGQRTIVLDSEETGS